MRNRKVWIDVPVSQGLKSCPWTATAGHEGTGDNNQHSAIFTAPALLF